MTTPPFVVDLFGRRPKNGLPNVSDAASKPSVNIAAAVMDSLGVPAGRIITDSKAGAAFEVGMTEWLALELVARAPDRAWSVSRKQPVTAFQQYAHLARLQALIDNDETKTLKAEIGTDYVIAPDVTVGLQLATGSYLHASVSCKWSIRSDRVQNIRHEAIILTRHRRGRQPHIVAVTAEPLPTRIAAIARGTGEVDAVYHVALPQLIEATKVHGSGEQQSVLAELVDQSRLFDITVLPQILVD